MRFIALILLILTGCAPTLQLFHVDHISPETNLIAAQDLEYVISVEVLSSGVYGTFWAVNDLAEVHDQMQQIACVSRSHMPANSSLTVTGWVEDSDLVIVAMVGYEKLMALDCSKRVDWPAWADEYHAD
jgi:hypothetical protein